MMQGGLCSKALVIKLIVMTWIWVAALSTYSTIGIYLKYVPGSIYLNFAISGLSEIMAHVVTAAVFLKLTPRWTFFTGFVIAFIGGICLVW